MPTFVHRGSERLQSLPSQFFAQLVAQVQAKQAAGYDIINLGQGNPDLPTPSHIIQMLQEASMDVQFHRYPPFRGYPFLKEAIIERYREDYGVTLDMDEVAIISGGKTGLVALPSILLDPGQRCAIPDPGYPDYVSGLAMAGVERITMPLLQKNGYIPDLEALVQHRPKMMFLNYPHNPTGTVAPASFYEEVVAWAERHQVIVVSDFAYGAIAFDGGVPPSFLSVPGAKNVGLEIYTLSKTYNMAGWRVAFALGNRDIIRCIEQWQEHLYVSFFGAVQQAAATALRAPQDAVHSLVQTYAQRRTTWYKATTAFGWHVPQRCAGTFFAWMPVPQGVDSWTFAQRLLEEAHVMVAPGIGFGDHGDDHVRIALLTTEQRLQEAADRMARCW